MTTDDQRRVREVFDQVLDLPPVERSAELERLCANDAALHAAVRSLLDALEQAGEFLGSPSVSSSVSSSHATVQSAAIIEGPATIIGPYKLLQLIGEGGFGSVYMAEQERPVRRKVALKIIKLGMDTKQVIARFEAERQALAMMDHPNIAKVFDAGATETGRPYFVMELVRGEPITDYCDRHTLSVEQRLALFQQTCSAVQHAHQKGVIHRDIKPSNVMITLHDGRPVPKVIDFGIAKATNHRLTEKTVFTEFRQFIGTPEYMSPEQAEVSGLDIDTRSDIYSLGVLLYQLLTGTTPFDSSKLRSAAFGELQRIIREETPAKPSTRLSTLDSLPSVAAQRQTEPRKLGLIIRGDLDWIVMKALEKDRTRRYATANEFAADIQRHIDDEPVVASPPTLGYRVRKFVRRNRAAVTTTALLFAMLLLAVAGTTWGLVQAKRQERIAMDAAAAERQAKEQANTREAETRAVLDFVENKIFAAARPIGIEGGLGFDVKLADAVEAALPFLQNSFTNQPLIEARLRMTMGKSSEFLGKPGLAEQQWRRASAIYAVELGPDHPETLACIDALATACGEQGKYDDSKEFFIQAIDGRRRTLGNDHVDTLASIFNLGTLWYYTGDYDQADKCYGEALQGRRRVLGPDHPDTLQSIRALALLRLAQGRLWESEKLAREAAETCNSKFGPDHPDTLKSLAGLSNALKWQGKYIECEAVDRRVLGSQRRLLGDDHPTTLIARCNLAETLRNLRRYPEAEVLLREAIDGQRTRLGPDHPDTLISISRMGVLLFDMERYDEAETYYRQTLDGRRRRLGDEHSQTLVAINNMGFLLQRMGRLDEAAALYREAYEANRRARGEDHPDTLSNLNNIGLLLLAQGKLDEAETALRTALAGRRRTLGDSHPATQESLQNLAVLLMRSEQNAEAERMLRECWELRLKTLPADDARIAEAQSMLGKALANQGRFSDAQPLLLEAYQRLTPSAPAKSAGDAAQRIADLYDAWDKAEPNKGYDAKRAEWNVKLQAAQQPATAPAASQP